MVTILRVYLFISFVFLRKVPNEEDLRQWPEVTQFQAYGSPEKLERLESFQFLAQVSEAAKKGSFFSGPTTKAQLRS